MEFGVDYVDMVTEARADKALECAGACLDSVKSRAEVSVKKHGSKVMAIVGHHDCAGNPVCKEDHIEDIRNSVKAASGWFPGVKVVGLWIDDEWNVNEIC